MRRVQRFQANLAKLLLLSVFGSRADSHARQWLESREISTNDYTIYCTSEKIEPKAGRNLSVDNSQSIIDTKAKRQTLVLNVILSECVKK